MESLHPVRFIKCYDTGVVVNNTEDCVVRNIFLFVAVEVDDSQCVPVYDVYLYR